MEKIETPTVLQLIEQRSLVKLRVSSSQYEYISIYRLDLANFLTLPGSSEAMLFSIRSDVPLNEDAALLLEEIIRSRGYKDRLKLVEYSDATEEGLRIIHQFSRLADFRRSNFKKTDPLIRDLVDQFAATSSLASLNPYVQQGPVTGSRFFGRDNELSTLRLQTGKSFVISGMRRSGKTSLLMELSRRILLSQEANEIDVFINFETCQSIQSIPYTFLSRLAERLKAASPALSEWSDNLSDLANSRIWKDPKHLPRLENTIWKLVSTQIDASRIRFFFDEYDRVVSLERAYNHVFTRSLRDLVMRSKAPISKGRPFNGFLQFTFAGSKKLYEEVLSAGSPFHNLAERLHLHNFDLNTLTELVGKPLRDIRIEVKDSANVAQALLDITGGHPATAQHLLSLVVEDRSTEATRQIRAEDIRRVANNPMFLVPFKSILEMNLSSLGLFILAQMAINKREKINLDFIRGAGRARRVSFDENRVNIELEDLAESGYLQPFDFAAGHPTYKLAVPMVPKLFSQEDANHLLQILLNDKTCVAL